MKGGEQLRELKKGDRVKIGRQRGKVIQSVDGDEETVAVEIDSVKLEQPRLGLVEREDVELDEER